MCGIFGILELKGKIDRGRFNLPNQTEILRHRGPDDYGYFIDSNIYLGHRRLSIIDLEGGNQPIFNEDGLKCIVFNGEVFNFLEIRKDLETRGHRFSTNSDTETILHSYEEWGDRCVDRFRGMFAFAIWDSSKKKLFIARDRLGIKPLFYALIGDTLYFASEMKAILQYSFFPREMDMDALGAYFMLSYIPAPMTIFKHIRKLLPGHALEVTNGKVAISQYWDLRFIPDHTKKEDYFIDGFMGLLEEAVKLRLISDVPLGAFLSGGIDSGTIVALMSGLSTEPVRTFNIGFGGNTGGFLDERGFAREVAERYGAIHQEFEVTPDVTGVVTDIVKAFDEPFADSSTIPSYYVSKITRQNVTVALSGLGGDELFGGYERYLGFSLANAYRRIPWVIREKVMRPLIEALPERRDGQYTVNHLKRFVRSASLEDARCYTSFISILERERRASLFSEPEMLRESFQRIEDLMLEYFHTENATDPMDRVFYLDMKTWLPEDILACTDRTSMWHSLEVRVPFLDHKLVEFCATIPNGLKVKGREKKYLLKKAVANLLPAEVINHRKQGFDSPMTKWLQTDLKPFVLDVLSNKNLSKHGLFNIETVNTILSEHFNRVEIHDKLIWSLMIFQIWYELYLERNYPTK
jgi:asparagine synthase (glutamine-hydrolysing)